MTKFQNATLTPDDKAGLQKLLLYFIGNYQNIFSSFLSEVFPGFVVGDKLDILSPLFSTRNPNSTLLNLALSNFNNSCNNSTSNVTTQSCDQGFVFDPLNGFCYKVLKKASNYWSASQSCIDVGAELVGFDNDLEVKGLISLFNNRNIFCPYYCFYSNCMKCLFTHL